MTDKKDNVIDIKQAKKKRRQHIFFRTSNTEIKDTDYDNSYKSCFTCLHYRKSMHGLDQCGHYPHGNLHKITVGPCSYEHGKFLWSPKKKSLWCRFKEKLFG